VRWSHRSIASVYWRRRPFDSAAAIHRAAWRGEADDGGFVINWTTGDGSKGWDSVGVIAIIAPAEHEGRSVLEFSVENFPNNSPSPAPVEGFGLDREQLRFSISSTSLHGIVLTRPPDIHTDGYAPSLEVAKAKFKRNWILWLKWSEQTEAE